VDKMVDTEFFQWSCKMFEKSVMTEFCNKKSTNADLEHEVSTNLCHIIFFGTQICNVLTCT